MPAGSRCPLTSTPRQASLVRPAGSRAGLLRALRNAGQLRSDVEGAATSRDGSGRPTPEVALGIGRLGSGVCRAHVVRVADAAGESPEAVVVGLRVSVVGRRR